MNAIFCQFQNLRYCVVRDLEIIACFREAEEAARYINALPSMEGLRLLSTLEDLSMYVRALVRNQQEKENLER